MYPNSGARRVPMHPIGADVSLDDLHKLMRDDPEGGFSHHFPRALIFCERVVECDLLIGETRFLATPTTISSTSPGTKGRLRAASHGSPAAFSI
jgi:hypothetical protein